MRMIKPAILFFFLLISGLRYAVHAQEAGVSQKLETVKVEKLDAGAGVKAVVMGMDAAKVYSVNLEGLSIYEFDRRSRKIERKLVFVPHRGKGYNYQKRVWIDSYQEKPVEAHITHEGRFLWISLHNGSGVVVWDLREGNTYVEGRPYKDAYVYERFEETDDSKHSFRKKAVKLLWIKTGATPKVVTSSPDGRYLFVSNWHSNSVSVIQIDSNEPKDWVKIKDLKLGPIPRGMIVSPDGQLLYVAQMGGDFISAVALESLEAVERIQVGINPRHVIVDRGYLYVSLNRTDKLVKYDRVKKQIVGAVNTGKRPRTMAATKDGRIVFVVCYYGESLEAFSSEDFTPLGRWESKIHPVAVDIFEDGDIVEVWVGNQSSGTIKIFTMKRSSGLSISSTTQ